MPVSTGRVLLTVAALVPSFGAFMADWNETHLYNPRFTPHAIYHVGQTITLALLLGFTTLYYIHGPPSSSPSATTESKLAAIHTASWIASLCWFSQLAAAFYPGSLPVDPEFGTGFPQLYLVVTFLSMIAAGTLLERRRLGADAIKKD
jgi:hypothetical protein